MKLFINECLFERNVARAGAGMFDVSSLGNGRVTQVIINNSTFLRNSARQLGGAYCVVSFAQSFLPLGRSEVGLGL